MKMNKEQFLKTEFGGELESTITAWDDALSRNREDKEVLRTLAWCQAQWEVYRMAIKHFYGVEYHFTRTDEYFKSGLDGKVVYEDVECALSTHTGGKLQQSKSTAKTETTFCLFTRPEVDIQTNDFLVITHFGKKIEAVAGFPECMKSHNNIPVKLDKETV